MKKIIITLVVLGFAFGAMAQQFPFGLKAQPVGLIRQQLLKPDSLSRNTFLLKQPDSPAVKPVFKVNVTGKVNIDNMPIARMPGNSTMPIVQTDRTAYNMPFMGGEQPLYYNLKKYPNNTEPIPSDNTKK